MLVSFAKKGLLMLWALQKEKKNNQNTDTPKYLHF